MVFGAVALTQSLLPHFRERKTGHILNVSSTGGFAGFAGWGAYDAAKAALELFSECLSIEVAAFNIRVLILVPGYFPTNFFSYATTVNKDKESRVYTDPSQGFRTLEEIPQKQVNARQVGDVEKLAARVFEVVREAGIVEPTKNSQTMKQEWLRIPLGSDCGELMLRKIRVLEENVNALEPIWRSTDMHQVEQLGD